MNRAGILLAFLGTLCRLQHVSSEAAPLSTFFDGEAAPFGGPQDGVTADELSGPLLLGSCGYGQLSPSTWPYWSVASVSASNPALVADGSGGCGACLEVACTGSAACAPAVRNGPQPVVFVADVCDTCAASQLSIHISFFQRAIGNPGNGSLPVQFRQVECEPPAAMVMRVETYTVSQGGSLRLVPMQVAGSGALTDVELRATDGEGVSDWARIWRSMNNSGGAVWALADLYPPPFDLRLTDSLGRSTVADRAIPLPAEGDYTTDAQFSTADKPGSSDEYARGTPLAQQPPSPPQPDPAQATPPTAGDGAGPDSAAAPGPADPFADLKWPPPPPNSPPPPPEETIVATPLQDPLPWAASPTPSSGTPGPGPPRSSWSPVNSPPVNSFYIAAPAPHAASPFRTIAAARGSPAAGPKVAASSPPPPTGSKSVQLNLNSVGNPPPPPGASPVTELNLSTLIPPPGMKAPSGTGPAPAPAMSMQGSAPQQQQCIPSPYDFLQSQPQFSTFLGNAEELGITPLLQTNSTEQTVFSPSNAAWAHLPLGLVVNGSRSLDNLMLYHIALGDRNTASLAVSPAAQEVQQSSGPSGFVPITTLQGGTLYAQPAPGGSELVLLGGSGSGSHVKTTLAQATCSGMVYGLDTVLVPPTR